jgi:tetratricopeptide (TPR) repeat protein
MFIRLSMISILLFVCGRVSAQDTDQAKIRTALRLPIVTVMFEIQFHSRDEISLFEEKDGWKRRITELKRQITAKPDDVQLWLDLGEAYQKDQQSPKAKETFLQAETKARQQVKASSHLPHAEQGRRMALLGVALNYRSKIPEAETTLRRATALAPKEWFVWRSLGMHLSSNLMATLYDKKELTGGEPTAEGGSEHKYPNVPPPSPKRAKRTLQQAAEAEKCLNRAIALAPQRGTLYMDRFTLRTSNGWVIHVAKLGLGQAQAEPLNPQTYSYETWTRPENLRDLRSAVKHGETTAVVGIAAFYEMFTAVIQSKYSGESSPFFSSDVWNSYSETTRQTIRTAVRKLGKFAVSQPASKENALAARGLFRLIMGEKDPGIADIRTALKTRPTFNSVWNILLGAAVFDKNFVEAERILREILQTFDTPRYHIFLAKVYQNLGRREEEKAQVALALKRDPNDPLALLSAATIALQDGGQTNQTQAEKNIDAAEKRLAEEDELRAHAEMLRGLLMLLRGNKVDGLQRIHDVLTDQSDNQQAKDLLAAFEQDSP